MAVRKGTLHPGQEDLAPSDDRPRPTGDRHRESDPVWGWLDRSVAVGWRLGLLLLVVLAAGLVLSRLWLVVLPVVVALLVTAVLSPPTRWLERRGAPPLAATWVIFLSLAAALVALAWLFGPRFVDETSRLPAAVDDALEEGRSWLVNGPFQVRESELDRWLDQAQDAVVRNRGAIVNGVVSYAFAALHLIAGALMTVVLTFFFVKDGPRMVEWALSQVEGDRRETLREVGSRAWTTLSGYVTGSALNGLVEAVLKAIGLLILGVPLVVPLAMLTFFGGFLPFFGAFVAGAVSALVALATKGPVTALLVVALSIVIQNVEGNLLQPLIMGKVVKLHPAVVLVAVATGGLLLGLPGAFLAVPVAATTANVVGYLRTTENSDADSTP